MRRAFLAITLLTLTVPCLQAQVTSNGGFVSNGSPGAGTVACSAGTEPGYSLTAVGFTCPATISTGFYFVMPASPTGTSNLPLIAGLKDANGNVPLSFGTYQGTGTAVCTATGSFTSGNLLEADASGNVKDASIAANGVVLGAGNLTTQYGIPYNTSPSGTVTQLGPNTAATPKFLTMTGTGSAGAAPAWAAASGNAVVVATANSNVSSANSGNYLSIDSNGNAQNSGANAGPYSIPWFTLPTLFTSQAITIPHNFMGLYGFTLTYPVTTTQIGYYVIAKDTPGTNHYDIGLYCDQTACGSFTSGQLVTHIGATLGSTFAASANSYTSTSWTSSATLQPAKYLLAITTDCGSGCATIAAGSTSTSELTFYYNTTSYSSSGGGLTSPSITAPSDGYTTNILPSVQVR